MDKVDTEKLTELLTPAIAGAMESLGDKAHELSIFCNEDANNAWDALLIKLEKGDK